LPGAPGPEGPLIGKVVTGMLECTRVLLLKCMRGKIGKTEKW